MEEEIVKDAKTILIVDDEQPIVDILVYNLKKEGYNTIEASDGITAINVALEQKPDLILLDIMLPKLDGLSVCKRIKNSFASCRIWDYKRRNQRICKNFRDKNL